jgi:organic radical activating enzyme
MVTDKNSIAHEVEQETIPSIHRLYFYLTESCNLSCRHCYLAPKFDSTGDKYPTIPIELFKTAIREAKPLGLKQVKLTGGEPLLHPQFEKLLAIVRSEGLSLNVETNGMLCTAKIASEIAKSPQVPPMIGSAACRGRLNERSRRFETSQLWTPHHRLSCPSCAVMLTKWRL